MAFPGIFTYNLGTLGLFSATFKEVLTSCLLSCATNPFERGLSILKTPFQKGDKKTNILTAVSPESNLFTLKIRIQTAMS